MLAQSVMKEGECPGCDLPDLQLYKGPDDVWRCLDCTKQVGRVEGDDAPHAGHEKVVDDDTLRAAVLAASSWIAAGQATGLSDVAVRVRAIAMDVDLGHSPRKPMAPRGQQKKASDKEIIEAVEAVDTWSAAARALGLAPKTVRERGRSLGVLPKNGGRQGRGPGVNGTEAVTPETKPDSPASRVQRVSRGYDPPGRDDSDHPVIIERTVLEARVEGWNLEADQDGITILNGTETFSIPPGVPPDVLTVAALMLRRLTAFPRTEPIERETP